MRSPGVIYRRYRQIKRKILYEKIVESRKKEHKNCFYGSILKATKDGETRLIKICALNSFYPKKQKNFELCTCPKDCNAFVNKHTKEKIENNFNNILKNDKKLNKEHPDLFVLKWVLDKKLTENIKNPTGFIKYIVVIIEFLEEIIKKLDKNQKNLQ